MDFRPYLALSVLAACCTSADFANAETPSLFSAFTDVDQVFAPDVTATQLVSYECSPDDGCVDTSGCGEGCASGTGCCDDLLTRTSLTNGLWGGGMKMAEHGVVADLQVTQFYQGVSGGGTTQEFLYGGKADYMLTFVGERLGLNKGFNVLMHAETQFGNSLVRQAGAFALPNTNMLYPLPNAQDTAITGLLLMQSLNEKVTIAAGKLNVVDFWTMVYPHVGRGVEGFQNLNALAAGLPWLRYVNLSVNAAGVLVMEGQQVQGGVLVFDLHNVTTTAGLDKLFDGGAGVLGVWRFFHDWNGKPGSHLFAFGGSTGTYTSLDRTEWGLIPPGQGGGLAPGMQTGTWTAAYYFNQVVWADRCNADRNVRVFSGWSLGDDNPSFARWAGNISVEGYGLIKGREKDRMGAAYFYTGLSQNFKDLVNPLPTVEVHDLHYNAEVTPWFHLTADLQIVDSATVANDTAVIVGLRANIKL